MRTWKNIDYGHISQASKEAARSILTLATAGQDLLRVGEKKYNIARDLYYGVIKLNKYREKELELDSQFHEKGALLLRAEQDDKLPILQNKAKKLGIIIYCGVWWHVKRFSDNRDVTTNKF